MLEIVVFWEQGNEERKKGYGGNMGGVSWRMKGGRRGSGWEVLGL